VVIGAEQHGSILHNCNREGIEPLDVRTDPEPDTTGVKRKKKHFIFTLRKKKKLWRHLIIPFTLFSQI
jgi:hypothetical protein